MAWEKFFTFNATSKTDITVNFKDNNAAKQAIQSLSPDCLDKLDELLKHLKGEPNLGFENPLRALSFLEVFDALNSQATGGIRLNSSDAQFKEHTGYTAGLDAGGGGWTLVRGGEGRFQGRAADAYVHVYSSGYSMLPTYPGERVTPASRVALGRIAIQINMNRLIHELVHGAGKYADFSHKAMDAAAVAVDPDLKRFAWGESATAFMEFVNKHCTNTIKEPTIYTGGPRP